MSLHNAEGNDYTASGVFTAATPRNNFSFGAVVSQTAGVISPMAPVPPFFLIAIKTLVHTGSLGIVTKLSSGEKRAGLC